MRHFSAAFLWTVCLLMFAWHVRQPGIPEYDPVAEHMAAREARIAKWGHASPVKSISRPIGDSPDRLKGFGLVAGGQKSEASLREK